MEEDTSAHWEMSFVELGLLFNIIIPFLLICYESQQTLKLQLKFNQVIRFAYLCNTFDSPAFYFDWF